MKVLLMSETSGRNPIEFRQYFAEVRQVSWDGCAPLPQSLPAVLRKARSHAEQVAGGPVYLSQLNLQEAGTEGGDRQYFYTLYFNRCDETGNQISVVMDLRGNVIEPEVRHFKSQKDYANFAYGKKRLSDLRSPPIR
jgi:hypothetical protein